MTIQKLILWCRRTMAGALCGFVFFVPISIALIEIFFGIALVSFFLKRGLQFYLELKQRRAGQGKLSALETVRLFLKSYKPVENYLNRPIALFILIGFLSIFASSYPILSIKGFFFKLLESTFLYFIFIEAVSTRKQLKIFLGFFLLSAALAVVNGLVQQTSGREFIFGNELWKGRVNSSFRHPNDFGGYLVVIAPLALSFLFFPDEIQSVQPGILRRKISRWTIPLIVFLFVLFVSSVICLGLTFSRGAWLAFFVALVFLGFQNPRLFFLQILIIVNFLVIFSPRMQEERLLSLFADEIRPPDPPVPAAASPEKESSAGAGGSLPISAAAVLEPLPKELLSWWKRDWESINHFGGSGRSGYWQESWAIIRHFPLLGVGLNTYSMVARNYKVNWGGYPHNCYLQLTAEMGILGLLSLMWILFTLFIQSLRRRIGDPWLQSISIGALTGLLAFLVHSAVDTNFYSVQLGNFMWLIMGLVVAAQKIYDGETKS